MGLFSKPLSMNDFATFCGAAMAKVTPMLARGETFAPLGVMRKSGLLGARNGGRQFVVNGKGADAGKIDLGKSVIQALEWMETAIPEGDAVGVVFDGALGEGDSKQEALIGRFASVKTQTLVEIALPYRKAEGETPFAISDPQFRFNAIAAEGDAEQQVNIDPTQFDAAFRNGFTRPSATS